MGGVGGWGGWGGGGGQTICYVGACCAMQNSTELEQMGNIYAFSLHTLSQIVQQMTNKLLHVLFPYKVSKITQDRKNTTPILSFK